MPTITVNASGFVLDGPLVAGEPAAVSVSGVEFAESPRPCVTIRARFPNALLASADLTFDENAGAWTGTLYTATKQTVLAFLTARADEARPVALELIDAEHSESVARVSVPMLNSSLLPTDNPPDAHGPEYLGVPGEKGDKGDEGGGALVVETSASVSGSENTAKFKGGVLRTIISTTTAGTSVFSIASTPDTGDEQPEGVALRSVLVISPLFGSTAIKVVTQAASYTMPAGKPAVLEAWVLKNGGVTQIMTRASMPA